MSLKAKTCIAPVAIVLGLALAAAPAAAAPLYDLGLTRDEVEVSHSDARVDYTVTVANAAQALTEPPGAGSELLCDGASPPLGTKAWNREGAGNVYSFEFRWLRDGEPVAGWDVGADYTVQGADAGHALQCLVKGSNVTGSGSFVAASQPVIVVEPPAAVEPPRPDNPTGGSRRPAIAGSAKNAGEELTCTAPTAWSGAPIAWSFEWLRDGEPAVGGGGGTVTETTATSSTYELSAADVSAPGAPSVFQCLAKATNVGGSAVVESASIPTEAPAPGFGPAGAADFGPNLLPGQTPAIERAETTVIGTVALELELPGGDETYAFKILGNGWSCASQRAAGSAHARVTCTRTEPLVAEHAYPPLTVEVALGADAPDLAVARASISGGGGEPAGVTDAFVFTPLRPFEIVAFETKVAEQTGADYTQAGGHPFSAGASFTFSKYRQLGDEGGAFKIKPTEHAKSVVTATPQGFVGNVQALPRLCPSVQQVSELPATCPLDSLVGGISARLEGLEVLNIPIFAIEPETGTPAQFAFAIPGPRPTIYTFEPKLRPEDNYAITLEASPSGKIPGIIGADVTLCGYGATKGPLGFTGCKKPGDLGAFETPLITNPTRCGAPPPVTKLSVNSWENPERYVSREFAAPEVTGCEAVDFEPKIDFEPLSTQADSPTGMDVELSMPTEGLERTEDCHEVQGDPESEVVAGECIAQANLKATKVTLPEGMAVNASAGHGLGACTSEQIKLGTNEPISCPDGSKIGTVQIRTPLLADPLHGAVYVAKQGDNPFGSLLALYIVLDSERYGLLIKIAGRVDPDPRTGRLVVSFEENPEAPFSSVALHFPQGPRSPLLNPPRCGSYQITSELTPWNGGPPLTRRQSFEVSEGPGGSPCPEGALEPELSAGVTDPVAGKTSPFVLRLQREDGSDRFTSLQVKTPEGLTAYLKGVPYCPEAALASISEAPGSGQGQIDNPSCPAASQVGSVEAGAGAGPEPFYVKTGKAYLAGPYKGAPLSLVTVVPAVAGPLDLGSVAIRSALHVNSETAQVSVVSDPLPTILHGILLDVRDVRVKIDRPGFILNPTDCEAKSVEAQVGGQGGATADLSERFRVGECEKLSFGPKFFLRLFGATKRGGHPKLRTVLTAGPGEANIARAAVTIPRSEFLDQAHIRTICTRVQFAAKACPRGSVYGYAKAFTPLLEDPVQGPVYLRSSDHKLPDLVVALRGPDHQPVEAVVVGRIDSHKGQIRATIEGAPDVPVSKFILYQRGGNRGLLINSRDICAHRNKATVRLTAHNGATHNFRPVVRNSRCAKQRRAKRSRTVHGRG